MVERRERLAVAPLDAQYQGKVHGASEAELSAPGKVGHVLEHGNVEERVVEVEVHAVWGG